MPPASPPQRRAVGKAAEGDFHLQRQRDGGRATCISIRGGRPGGVRGVADRGFQPGPCPALLTLGSAGGGLWVLTRPPSPSPRTPTVTFFLRVLSCVWPIPRDLTRVSTGKTGGKWVSRAAFPSMISAFLRSHSLSGWKGEEQYLMISLGEARKQRWSSLLFTWLKGAFSPFQPPPPTARPAGRSPGGVGGAGGTQGTAPLTHLKPG